MEIISGEVVRASEVTIGNCVLMIDKKSSAGRLRLEELEMGHRSCTSELQSWLRYSWDRLYVSPT